MMGHDGPATWTATPSARKNGAANYPEDVAPVWKAPTGPA